MEVISPTSQEVLNAVIFTKAPSIGPGTFQVILSMLKCENLSSGFLDHLGIGTWDGKSSVFIFSVVIFPHLPHPVSSSGFSLKLPGGWWQKELLFLIYPNSEIIAI